MKYNRVLIGGHFTRDPELRYGQSGTAYVKFSLGTQEGFGKNAKPCFVDLVAFGKTAEVIAEHHKKGNPIFVEGELSQSTWTDKNTGQNRSKLEIKVSSFQFVNSKSDRGDSGGADESVL